MLPRSRVFRWNHDVIFAYKFFSSQFALLRALPRPARVSLILFFAAALADGVLMPFFALWAQREGGVSTAHIGLLFGCYAGGELLATPFVGGVADRLGRRPVLLASTAGVGVGFLLLYLSRGVFACAGALLFIGVFESVLHPAAAAVIADVSPADKTRAHFALARVASSFGQVVGPALGALLVRWSLGLVFVGSAASLLTACLVTACSLPETLVPGSTGQDDDDDNPLALTAAFQDAHLAALLLPVMFSRTAASWIEAVLPLFATHAGTLSPSGVGLLFTYAGVLGVYFQLPILHASARMPGSSLVMASGVALTVAFGCLAFSAGLPFLIAAVTLLAFSGMLAEPLIQALVSELAPQHARTTYMAALSVVSDLRDTVGPAVGTSLYAMAVSLPWMVGAPIALVATLALALPLRRQEATRAPITEA